MTESVPETFPLPPRFTVRPLAWCEINVELDYLEGQAGPETAERFFDQLIGTFESPIPNAENWVSVRFP